MTSVHCVVSGRVQGVWFRAWTRQQALELGLAGWVRNLADGSVETVAQGSEAAIQEFRQRLWQGSPGSHVVGVDCSEDRSAAADIFTDFTIRR